MDRDLEAYVFKNRSTATHDTEDVKMMWSVKFPESFGEAVVKGIPRNKRFQRGHRVAMLLNNGYQGLQFPITVIFRERLKLSGLLDKFTHPEVFDCRGPL